MNAKLCAVLIGIVVWMVAWMGTGSTGAEDVPRLPTTVVGVSLFKNGLGFMAREARLPKGDATVVIDGLPAPVHGTLWVQTRGDATALTDLVAFERESIERVPALTVAELL